MLFGRLASAALLTLAASATVAYADPITVSGTFNVTDNNAKGDNLNFSTTYDAGQTITNTFAGVGSSVTYDPLASLMTADSSFLTLQTASLEFTINYTAPSAATASVGGTLSELTGIIGSSGTLDWSGGNGCLTGPTGCNVEDITFSDGAEVQLTLGDTTFTRTLGKNDTTDFAATETLLKAPTSVTPEPASLALLATGLIGLPLLLRKHFVA